MRVQFLIGLKCLLRIRVCHPYVDIFFCSIQPRVSIICRRHDGICVVWLLFVQYLKSSYIPIRNSSCHKWIIYSVRVGRAAISVCLSAAVSYTLLCFSVVPCTQLYISPIGNDEKKNTHTMFVCARVSVCIINTYTHLVFNITIWVCASVLHPSRDGFEKDANGGRPRL